MTCDSFKQSEGAALAQAKELLQSVIDGITDMFDATLADRLVTVGETYPDLDDLLNKAADTYSNYMIEAAHKALAQL